MFLRKHFCSSINLLNANLSSRTLSSTCKRNETFSPKIPDQGQVRPSTAQAITMLDIGCRDLFNADHDIFRESARKYFREEVVPHNDRFEEEGQVTRECWQKAGEQGLLGTDIDEKYGGIGADFKYTTIVLEEQSYANCSAPGITIHSGIVMPYLAEYGTLEQIKSFMPDMTAGKKVGALAMTEPQAGSDLQGIRTNARRDGDDWILNGSKIFITNGFLSDVVIVAALTDSGAKSAAHGCSLFLVEADSPGFKKGAKLKKMGQKAQDLCELFFEDVRLPSSSILGNMNKGFYFMMNQLPRERLLVAISACAHSEWMFEETRKYILQRKAFGKTLASLQTIQHKLAELKTNICVARAFTDQCIELYIQNRLDGSMASMCKYWTTDLQNRVAYDCVQLHGGWGYMMEYPIAKAFVDARPQSIYAGSNEIMKELIKRQIIGDKRL